MALSDGHSPARKSAALESSGAGIGCTALNPGRRSQRRRGVLELLNRTLAVGRYKMDHSQRRPERFAPLLLLACCCCHLGAVADAAAATFSADVSSGSLIAASTVWQPAQPSGKAAILRAFAEGAAPGDEGLNGHLPAPLPFFRRRKPSDASSGGSDTTRTDESESTTLATAAAEEDEGDPASIVAACVCAALIAATNPLVCATLWQIRHWKFAEYTMFQLALSDLTRCAALLWSAAGAGVVETPAQPTPQWRCRLGGAAIALPFVVSLVQVSCLSVNKMALVTSRLSLQAERSSWRLRGVCYNIGVWLAALTAVAAVAFAGRVHCLALRPASVASASAGSLSAFVLCARQSTLFWTLASLLLFAPVLSLTVSCVVILRVARQKAAAAARAASDGRRGRSARPTRAILTIGATVGIFYSCNLPAVAAAAIAQSTEAGSYGDDSLWQAFIGVSFYLMQAGGFINFLLYYLTDRKFRKAAHSLWTRCCSRGGFGGAGGGSPRHSDLRPTQPKPPLVRLPRRTTAAAAVASAFDLSASDCFS